MVMYCLCIVYIFGLFNFVIKEIKSFEFFAISDLAGSFYQILDFKPRVKYWTANFCIHASTGPVIIMNQLKYINLQ